MPTLGAAILSRFRRGRTPTPGQNNGQQAAPNISAYPPPPSPGIPGQGQPAGPGRVAAKPLFLCKPFVTSQLVKGSFSTIVVLPKYVDQGEWLALNIFEFFDMLNRFFGVVQEFCTQKNCPSMSAGPGLDYTWLDSNRMALRLPAPQYIEYVLLWISNRINDEAIFPTKSVGTTTATAATPSAIRSGSASGAALTQGGERWVGKDGGFPQNYLVICKAIYKQMFRVFAHIYHTHFDKMLHMSLEAHFNSLFAHFIHFSRTFDLLEPRDIEPLRALIDTFEEQGLFKDVSSAKAQ